MKVVFEQIRDCLELWLCLDLIEVTSDIRLYYFVKKIVEMSASLCLLVDLFHCQCV